MEYIPGICNIGPAEVRSKKQVGLIGLFLAALFVWVSHIVHISSLLRLVVFLPIYLSVLCFIEAYVHFCVDLGLRGLYNMVHPAAKATDKVEKEYIVQDRSKAEIIIFSAFLGSVLLTILVSFI